MKPEEKGFRRNFIKFRTSAKMVPCSTKLPLYWQLIEECMEKDAENREFINERYSQFTRQRILNFERKQGMK